MISFKNWILIKEGGQGSGTKFSATGLNSGGMAQHSMRYRPVVNPIKSLKKLNKFKNVIIRHFPSSI